MSIYDSVEYQIVDLRGPEENARSCRWGVGQTTGGTLEVAGLWEDRVGMSDVR